jgi:hypothetical protein
MIGHAVSICLEVCQPLKVIWEASSVKSKMKTCNILAKWFSSNENVFTCWEAAIEVVLWPAWNEAWIKVNGISVD